MLNSKTEYNRCILPELSVNLGKNKQMEPESSGQTKRGEKGVLRGDTAPVQPNGGKRKKLEVSKKRQLEEIATSSENQQKNSKTPKKIIKPLKPNNNLINPQAVERSDSSKSQETKEIEKNKTGEDKTGINQGLTNKNSPPLKTLQRHLK